MQSVPLPELQYFKLGLEPTDFNEEYNLALAEATLVDPSPLFLDIPTKLDTVKIKGLSNPFLFGHSNQLHLSSLTHLELDFVGSPPSLLDISRMLQVTGQLIVLHLTFGFIKPNLIELDLRMPKIKLHHLRELGLLFVKEAF
ncbi:hypothetical protein FRC09_013632 [Ceratobasidium sp. 395]|nr:hypothetical protein FRC09_013632 [Ceratobasidium sp. 395]